MTSKNEILAVGQKSGFRAETGALTLLETGKREFNDKVVWCFFSSEALQKRQRSSPQQQSDSKFKMLRYWSWGGENLANVLLIFFQKRSAPEVKRSSTQKHQRSRIKSWNREKDNKVYCLFPIAKRSRSETFQYPEAPALQYLLTLNQPPKRFQMDIKKIEKEALDLPADQRAKLAQRLILSIDTPRAKQLQNVWLIEASRRARELDDGAVQPIPAEEVRKKAMSLLR